MQLIIGQVTGFDEKDGKLTEVKVTGADGVTRRVPLDMLLVFFGLSPKLGPIAEWGLDIERRQLKVVNTESSKPMCRAFLPWATSTPTRARRN
jgi:thioredoxin reductase (NADPH)